MRTAASAVIAQALSEGMIRVAGPLWDPTVQYAAGATVAFAGHTMQATADVARGQYPQGLGDGTVGDRDILMGQRNGFAAAVTGGYAGPTYVVSRTDDAVDGSGNPVPGTLRYGLSGRYGTDHGGNYWDPLWIVFDPALGATPTITVDGTAAALTPLAVAPNKTLDGRGRQVTIQLTGSGINKGLTVAGIKNPNNAHTPWNVDGSGYTGVANVILAFVTVANLSVGDVTAEVFTASYGSDLVWLHHCELYGGADIIVGLLGEYDYIVQHPTFGLHPENHLGRYTIDWCILGPAPTATAFSFTLNLSPSPFQGAYLTADNQATDGKCCSNGLHPQDGYRADNNRATFHHCVFRDTKARNPKCLVSRTHFYNNWVDHFGAYVGLASPTYMAIPADVTFPVPGGNALGWSVAARAGLGAAKHESWPFPVWDQTAVAPKGYGHGIDLGRDGELLCEANVFTGYTAGEEHRQSQALVDAGVITTGQRWRVQDPQAKAVLVSTKHGAGDNSWPDPILYSHGELFEGTAAYDSAVTVLTGVGVTPDHRVAPFSGVPPIFRGWRQGHYETNTLRYVRNNNGTWVQDAAVGGDGGGGPDWGGLPPYAHVLLAADVTLKADLTRGSGNLQPWLALT